MERNIERIDNMDSGSQILANKIQELLHSS